MGSFIGMVGDGENTSTFVNCPCQSYIYINTSSDLTVSLGHDMCASFKHTVCPRNSLCINTLGSFTCVCQHGHYDVSLVIEPRLASNPICNGIVAPSFTLFIDLYLINT